MIKPLNITLIVGIILILILALIIVYKPYKPERQAKKTISPLTKEKLRCYKGLENITDVEAENIIYSLKKYSELTYQLFYEERQINTTQQFN
jgi:hypothetical protein